MTLSRSIDAGAASRVRDDLPPACLDNCFNHVRFGLPYIGIVDVDRLAKRSTEELTEMMERQWMSGPGGSAADELGRVRQIHADDTVFEEANPVILEKVPDDA